MTETYWELEFLNLRKQQNGWQYASGNIRTEEKALKLRDEMNRLYDNDDFGLRYRAAKIVKTIVGE